MSAGGKSTNGRPKVRSPGSEKRALETDPDAIDPSKIDPRSIKFIEMEMSPALRARLRARRMLRQLTIRLSTVQIEAARRIARRRGEPYQRLLRQWITEGLKRDARSHRSPVRP